MGGEGGDLLTSLVTVGCRSESGWSLESQRASAQCNEGFLGAIFSSTLASFNIWTEQQVCGFCSCPAPFPGATETSKGYRELERDAITPHLSSKHGTGQSGPSRSSKSETAPIVSSRGAQTPKFCSRSRWACQCPLTAGISL